MITPKPYHPIQVKLTPEEYKAFRKLCVENDTNPTHAAAELVRRELKQVLYVATDKASERLSAMTQQQRDKAGREALAKIIEQANQDADKQEVRFALLKPPAK